MSATHLWAGTIFSILVFAPPSWGGEAPKASESEKPRVDLHGDPLPKGAIARLGTLRFRHAGMVASVAFSEDGKLVAASSYGPNRVVIWDRATGHKLREIPAGRVVPPAPLRFSADGKRLYGSVSYNRDTTFYAWKIATAADDPAFPKPPAGSRVLGYSADAREVILLHNEAEIVRWSLEKGKELSRYPQPAGPLYIAAQRGERLLVPRFDGQAVNMWDAVRKERLWSVKTTRHKDYPGLPMEFSTDGKLFAVEAPPRGISICESVTGKTICRLEGDAGKIYWSVCFSPDGRTVVAGNLDGSLRLWDLPSGRERVKITTLRGRNKFVFFAPDSKVFATSGAAPSICGRRPAASRSTPCWTTATRSNPFRSLAMAGRRRVPAIIRSCSCGIREAAGCCARSKPRTKAT